MSAQVMTMSATPAPTNRLARGPSYHRPAATAATPGYTPRRRNALVPLPLLPAPPPHAIIKSVTVVHSGNFNGNSTASNGGTATPRGGRRRSSASSKAHNMAAQNASSNSGTLNNPSTTVPFPKSASPTSPTAPQTFSNKSKMNGPRRRSAGLFTGPPLAGRPAPPAPRQLSPSQSTFVVTVRLPPRPRCAPPIQPTVTSPVAQKQTFAPVIRPVSSFRRPFQEPAPLPPKPEFNRPRISSPIVTSTVITPDNLEEDRMVVDTPLLGSPLPPYGTPLHPRAVPRPRGKLSAPGTKPKPASLAMRKCAVLASSGPDKGRRIWCLGVKLAQEIWEAEECLKAQERAEADQDMSCDLPTPTDPILVTTTTTETWSDVVPVEEL